MIFTNNQEAVAYSWNPNKIGMTKLPIRVSLYTNIFCKPDIWIFLGISHDCWQQTHSLTLKSSKKSNLPRSPKLRFESKKARCFKQESPLDRLPTFIFHSRLGFGSVLSKKNVQNLPASWAQLVMREVSSDWFTPKSPQKQLCVCLANFCCLMNRQPKKKVGWFFCNVLKIPCPEDFGQGLIGALQVKLQVATHPSGLC